MVGERVLPEVVELPVGEAFEYFSALELPGHRGEIAAKILKEIQDRLGFLVNVGLNYLSCHEAQTPYPGEAQRIRLASQIGAGLVGVMYVLDEPSIGLHQRDNERLLNTLRVCAIWQHGHCGRARRRRGAFADVIDIGPGAGVHGGEVVVATPERL